MGNNGIIEAKLEVFLLIFLQVKTTRCVEKSGEYLY